MTSSVSPDPADSDPGSSDSEFYRIIAAILEAARRPSLPNPSDPPSAVEGSKF